MRVVHLATRFLGDLLAHARWTGRWWLPVVILALIAATLTVTVAKAAVPVVTYTLF